MTDEEIAAQAAQNLEEEAKAKAEAEQAEADRLAAEAGDEDDAEKLKESNKRLFERAKKAEAEAKLLKAERLKAEEKAKLPAAKTGEPDKGKADMSQDDLYAVIKANVPQEDIGDVKDYAALKNISVAEALKTNVVKTLLADKAEQRNVAAATDVGTARRGSAKVSDETILEQAQKGVMPDDADALARARMNTKLKK